MHPRTRKKISEIGDVSFNESIKFLNPFGFFDYLKLQTNAFCVLSDSGTITEEASLLNFPAVSIRESHERPEGFDGLSVCFADLKIENVLNGIDFISDSKTKLSKMSIDKVVSVYNKKPVSFHILNIVLSYISKINKTVWKK